ncbi:MAG: GGDEF domain-containing protein [Treponema sp.]|nr:GGDEF domain-containing protein [Treponema sp.]MBQ6566545.1 GGDEF domain-containing protein [Treponema sp.]
MNETSQEKEIFDLEQTLNLFRSLCTTIELPKLIQSILYTSMAQMRVTGAGMLTMGTLESGSFRLGANAVNLEVSPIIKYMIPTKSPLVSVLSSLASPVTLAQLRDKIPVCKDLDTIESLKPTLVVPLIFRRRVNGILLLGERIENEDGSDLSYSDYEKKQIATLASLGAIAVNNASLVEISSTDMMTHLKYKYYFYNILSDRMESSLNSNGILSVVMFDIDFFKKVNDTYGHNCGDYILASVASIIKTSIRGKDLAARYGGEEFTLLLSGESGRNAYRVAERIRKTVENYCFEYQGQKIAITISGGIAEFSGEINSGLSPEELVDVADKALYVSKNKGRNRITFAYPALIAALNSEPPEAD